ncbi:NADPH-dependent FMN reductase [Salipiger mangrovisoli]|uniref:NAD(P)H-dependent oxidoreductase n=1 Tax=Salipiger mangrovisoli TaxID=2865933 RepID=A0ABR9XB34_9RHOB|nr:NADPH-dependent FMN reductase [Salipiger mangrovisoli]MBE9640687.1 NAD(P)H-dependent oxidoreductase [Salipiger mangrovisoli]
MPRILGLSGSLRAASFNAGLLRAAMQVAPEGCPVLPGSIQEVPLFNADVEAAEGLPVAVKTLQAQLAEADALLLVTPEYNNGIPGVFKNAIDWMSRGEGGKLFKGKPVAIIGASPGGFGTILSQSHWLPVLRALGAQPWFGAKLMVSRAGQAFDADGTLTDDTVREQLRGFLAGFAATLD